MDLLKAEGGTDNPIRHMILLKRAIAQSATVLEEEQTRRQARIQTDRYSNRVAETEHTPRQTQARLQRHRHRAHIQTEIGTITDVAETRYTPRQRQ